MYVCREKNGRIRREKRGRIWEEEFDAFIHSSSELSAATDCKVWLHVRMMVWLCL